MFRLTTLSAILFVTTAINIIVWYISWRRKDSPAGLYFAFGMVGVVLWSFGDALDYSAASLTLNIFFSKIAAVGYLSAIPLFVLTSLCLAGRERWLEKKWVQALFVLVPLVSILIVWTNEWHHLFWVGFEAGANNLFVFRPGVAYSWIRSIYYLLLGFIFINFGAAYRKGSGYVKRQALLMMVATLVPFSTNILYQIRVAGSEGVDWTAVTFSLASLIFLYALYGLRFLDVIHIARDVVLERMDDVILVLDKQGRLADFNPPAGRLLGINQKEVWRPVAETTLANLPEILGILKSGENPPHEIQLGKKTFDVRLTPLEDQRNREFGQLLVMRDISERKAAEEALRASEKRFRELMMAAPDAVFGISEQSQIVFANEEATRLLGYPLKELVGMDVVQLIPAKVEELQVTRLAELRDHPGTRLMDSGLIKHKTGAEIPVDIKLSRVNTDAGLLVLAFVRDITERVQRDEALREAHTQVLEQQRTLAKMEERQSLARDMHDSVNQSIHSLMLFSETLVVLLQKKKIQEALNVSERIQQSGKQALKEIRLLLYRAQFMPIDAELDLLGALEERLNMVERRVGIKAEVSCEEEALANCPREWTENLYWIAMEALNNSLKYSQAQKIWVSIRGTGTNFEMILEDNGAGFDPRHLRIGGFGMKSMHDRARVLGGAVTITSAPGNGTQVCFRGAVNP